METFGFEFILLSFQSFLFVSLSFTPYPATASASTSAPSTSFCRRTNKSWSFGRFVSFVPFLASAISDSPLCFQNAGHSPGPAHTGRVRAHIPNDDVRNGCQGEQMMDRVNVFQGVEWTSRVSFGGIKKYPFSFAALVVPSSIHPAFLASTSGRVLAVKLKVSNICPNTQHTTKPPSGTFCRFMLWTTDYCAGLGCLCVCSALCVEPPP